MLEASSLPGYPIDSILTMTLKAHSLVETCVKPYQHTSRLVRVVLHMFIIFMITMLGHKIYLKSLKVFPQTGSPAGIQHVAEHISEIQAMRPEKLRLIGGELNLAVRLNKTVVGFIFRVLDTPNLFRSAVTDDDRMSESTSCVLSQHHICTTRLLDHQLTSNYLSPHAIVFFQVLMFERVCIFDSINKQRQDPRSENATIMNANIGCDLLFLGQYLKWRLDSARVGLDQFVPHQFRATVSKSFLQSDVFLSKKFSYRADFTSWVRCV